MREDVYQDEYEYYEAIYDPSWVAPKQRRGPKRRRATQEARSQVITQLTDDLSDVDVGYNTTYRPSRYEEGWLLDSLRPFYEEGLITDVLSMVKGGKEASVYCCEGHPARGGGLLAAKVYRPRMFRNLRNDKMYRQGREILTAGGNPAGRDAGYLERAIRNKTAFGAQAAHTSWLMYEFTAMETLYQAGAPVPQPIASSANAVLMTYHGSEELAAPTLNTVELPPEEARVLFQQVMRTIDLMLQHDLVHGDLSAFNILYWPRESTLGEITIIDFPQVVNLRGNKNAHDILKRDIQRVCEYFSRQGVLCDPPGIMRALWSRHVQQPHPQDVAADRSRIELMLAEMSAETERAG
jgi:RIO kinase 1